jgi:hypothetical protein
LFMFTRITTIYEKNCSLRQSLSYESFKCQQYVCRSRMILKRKLTY